MSAQWYIFGLDETGADQLGPHHKAALEGADMIVADDRFHAMLAPFAKDIKLEDWPKPFSALGDLLSPYQAKKLVIFTTGDPLFYGAGVTIKRLFPKQDIMIWPAVSGIAMAAGRMGWQIAEAEVISIHGRVATKIIPAIYPFAKWLVIPQSATSLHDVANLLSNRGCGAAQLSALQALGRDKEEACVTKTAADWLQDDLSDIADFFVMAVDLAPCGRIAFHSACGVLPDEAFISDGKLTKQDVRASAMSKLQPHPKGVLWDLGTGCGSIAIEWARLAQGAMAYGVDSRDDRLERARANAIALGTAHIKWLAGDVLDVMDELPEPDAIFIGGGLSEAVLDKALGYLPQGGRLVIHAVTLESEAILLGAHKRLGGHLTRIAVNKAEPVGAYRGWRGLMPVTQWVFIKQGEKN